MNGSRLHAEIMNLGTAGDILGQIEVATVGTGHAKTLNTISRASANLGMGEELSQLLQLAYKIGHRDARHAAAELALKP